MTKKIYLLILILGLSITLFGVGYLKNNSNNYFWGFYPGMSISEFNDNIKNRGYPLGKWKSSNNNIVEVKGLDASGLRRDITGTTYKGKFYWFRLYSPDEEKKLFLKWKKKLGTPDSRSAKYSYWFKGDLTYELKNSGRKIRILNLKIALEVDPNDYYTNKIKKIKNAVIF